MVDITHKISTHRIATAQAILVTGSENTIQAIKDNRIEKGNVFEMSKAAGLLAVKKTSDVIPDCHPMPIECTKVRHEIKGLEIQIQVEVHTIYKTGVEVEAMHGASVVALTMYDMLKPIDKNVSIKEIKLLEKSGGKSDFRSDTGTGYNVAIAVVSNSILKGAKEDTAGKLIKERVTKHNLTLSDYKLLPDDAKLLNEYILNKCNDTDLLLIAGGTGLTATDITPQTVAPLLDYEIPGVAEAIRSYGQQRTPYAMLSRCIAGVKNKTLIITLPGSTNGTKEALDALFPFILHSFKMIKAKMK